MKITPEIKSYLTTMIQLEAYIETIRPEIRKIYDDVFFYMIPKHIAVDKHTKEPITNAEYIYMLDYDDSKTKEYIDNYYIEVRKVLVEKGWKPSKPEFCYLLETESLLRDTKSHFVKACIKTLPAKVLEGDTPEQFYDRLYYPHYDKFVEINRKYFTQFISIKDLKKGLNLPT